MKRATMGLPLARVVGLGGPHVASWVAYETTGMAVPVELLSIAFAQTAGAPYACDLYTVTL
jgi:hypothetical protein